MKTFKIAITKTHVVYYTLQAENNDAATKILTKVYTGEVDIEDVATFTHEGIGDQSDYRLVCPDGHIEYIGD